jgi:tetratricopeptide (TPR) repeat protein
VRLSHGLECAIRLSESVTLKDAVRGAGRLLLVVGCVFNFAGAAVGAELKEARELYLSGRYEECVALCEPEVATRNNEQWHLLLSQALMASGQYREAWQAITNSMARDRWNVRLMWQAREVFLANGQSKLAEDMREAVLEEVSTRPRDHRDVLSMVAFGEAALDRGADAKRVLTSVFDPAQKANPQAREVYIAAGKLALSKQDYALAAKKYEEGLKHLADDPDLHYGMARAFAPSDPDLVQSSLAAALSRNSNHVGSLLMLVDHSIDAEDMTQAEKLLEQVQRVNPAHPEAWAYRAVVAHLQNRPDAEREAHERALKFFPESAQTEHLIGRKLSQNYRFREGAAYQRKALSRNPRYSPAKAQLAQDLLRLGQETEGWQLAQEVHEQDGYHVEAYNLTTLHDQMRKFTVLTNADFRLRMGAHEARLYGERALALLTRAKSNLCAKYGTEIEEPTVVDIFPEQKDFAVRTFGMPGNPGYLGVCFGNVITANSPAAHGGHPVNWEAVLWHEFCHVVTLQMTGNKMPRWLSEGISVYEEVQANPAWGQRMTPKYREMILGGELTPVSKLSGAFLAPPSALHLQFAYYQSSLVVEFLLERFGLPAVKQVLKSLAAGEPINQALEAHTVSMRELEPQFASFARARAEALAPGLDWERPEGRGAAAVKAGDGKGEATLHRWVGNGEGEWKEWAESRPTNFWVLSRQADELLAAKRFQEARPILEKLTSLYPGFTGSDSAWRQLAMVYRETGEKELEVATLSRFAEQDSEAPDVYLRLMDLAKQRQEWATVKLNSERHLAVNPLIPAPYRFLAEASEQTRDMRSAVAAYRALLELSPPDPAEMHFRLARALHRLGEPEAKRHVLLALEEAPLFREALKLLLEIERSSREPAMSAVRGGES